MTTRFLWITTLTLIGCRSSADTDETGDWWQSTSDTATTDTANGDVKDTGKGGGKDTGNGGGKDTGNGGKDTGNGGKGQGAIQGILTPESQSGEIGVGFTVDGEDCYVTYTASNFSENTDCSDCAFAWSFTLDSGTLVSGDPACTEAGNGLGGETLNWGHGSEEVSEKGGVSYHALMAAKDGAWSVVDGGFSWLTSKGGSEDAWNIYVMY